MKTSAAIATIVLIVQALSLGLFPGGAVLCDDGGGTATFKPIHGPRTLSCCEEARDGGRPSIAREDHEHRGCTDTDASAPFAPAEPFKLRSPADAPCASEAWMEHVASGVSPLVRSIAFSAPLSPHISTTVLRS